MPSDSCQLVLASASPRRREILGRLGLPFSVRPVAVDESVLPGEDAEQAAWRLALAKAVAVAGRGVVVAADTLVVDQGEALGKPEGAEEAFAMLRRLRAREHEVITGLAILDPDGRRGYISTTRTRVWMRPYADEEIAAYVAAGEPFDKAGAYAIQSTAFRPVARCEGCYLNVVGLPLCEVVKGLREIDYPLPSRAVLETACQECIDHLPREGMEKR